MLKRVSFENYRVLRLIHNIRVITANDTEAVILIQKQKRRKKQMMPAYNESYTHYSTRSGNTQLLLYRRKPTRRQKAERIYYIKQKLSGLTMATIGILIPFLCDGDATFSLIALPLGLFLMFTKEKVMMFQKLYDIIEEVLIYDIGRVYKRKRQKS